jgi:heme exporter protein A
VVAAAALHTLLWLAFILSFEGIEVSINGAPVVLSATCTVDPGSCLAILGPNGAGKTTLLRVMATLVKPTSGRGTVLGIPLTGADLTPVRPRIGLSGHLPALSPSLTLRENLEFAARLSGKAPDRVAPILELVGLGGAGDRLADRCSHGMKKRADLARLLLTEPDLLLLDEPLAGLDASAAPLVNELVARTKAKGGGAVLVSHDPASVYRLADHQMTLHGGVLTT